jgi:hypothetical protein
MTGIVEIWNVKMQIESFGMNVLKIGREQGFAQNVVV